MEIKSKKKEKGTKFMFLISNCHMVLQGGGGELWTLKSDLISESWHWKIIRKCFGKSGNNKRAVLHTHNKTPYQDYNYLYQAIHKYDTHKC